MKAYCASGFKALPVHAESSTGLWMSIGFSKCGTVPLFVLPPEVEEWGVVEEAEPTSCAKLEPPLFVTI